jgi:hypothetical protein
VDQLLIPEDLLPEQEALASQLANNSAYTAYYAGRFGKSHLMQIAMVWNGLAGAAGWETLAPMLHSDMRGPAAYFFGHRYLRLNRTNDAIAFWKAALADAPPNSPLDRLCQAELERVPQEKELRQEDP